VAQHGGGRRPNQHPPERQGLNGQESLYPCGGGGGGGGDGGDGGRGENGSQ